MEKTRKDIKQQLLGNVCHAYEKRHIIDQNTLKRYVNELQQVEYNEMKPNYVDLVLPGRVSKKVSV